MTHTVRTFKILTLALTGTSLLLCSMLVWSLWQAHLWREAVNGVATEAGWQWAMRSYAKGIRIVYDVTEVELSVDYNVAPQDSGRREGVFEIWTPDRWVGTSSQQRYAQRRLLEAYNKQMREIHSNFKSYKTELGLSDSTNSGSSAFNKSAPANRSLVGN
jgi:hypothetical protein